MSASASPAATRPESVAAAPAGSAVATRRRRRRTGIQGTSLAFWLFVGPFLVGLVVFTAIPIFWSGWLSLYNARATITPTQFVGLRNYADFLQDGAFLSSLRTFAIFAVFIVPVTMAISLILAILLNRLPFAQGFFRAVFFLPVACSYVVAALIWRLGLFTGLPSGLVNELLGPFGVDPISRWLTQSPYYWIVLVTVRLWLQVGFYMLLFLAGLQRIPDQLYEAAAVDGVRQGWRTFRYITLPQLRATTAAVLLLLIVAAFQAFDEFYNLVGNNPSTRPPLVYLYYVALGSQQDFGHGSAGAIILTLIMVVVALAQTRVFGFGGGNDDRKERRRTRRQREKRQKSQGVSA